MPAIAQASPAPGRPYWSPDSPNHCDALRLLLAALVIVSHSYLVIGRFTDEPLLRASSAQFTFGDIAVDCFFAISGFLITHSWVRSRTAADYFRRRARRIYPAYLAGAIVTYLVCGCFGATGEWLAPLRTLPLLPLVRDMALLHPIAIGNPLAPPPAVPQPNLSTWTICFEAGAYFLVAGFGAVGLFRTRHRWLVPAIFALLLAINGVQVLHLAPINVHKEAGWWFGVIPVPWETPWPRLLCFFLAGMCAYLLRDRIPRSRAVLLTATALLLVSTAFGTGAAVIAPICLTYALLYAAFSPRLPLQRFKTVLRGDYSYGLYLYAWPIQQSLAHLSPLLHRNPSLLSAATLPLGLAFAVASWHLVEKRFLVGGRGRRTPASGQDISPIV